MGPLHVILTSIGTDGDVLPYVALGAALARRGHRVTLAVSESYRGLVEANGLSLAPLVSREENERCFSDPDFWHPLKGPMVGAKWGVEFLPRQYELLAGLARDDGTSVLVASPGVVAARLVQETLRRPMASVALQPWLIRSSTAPPVMPAGLTLPRWAPRPVASLYWLVIDAVGAFLLGGPLNRLRRQLGLPPVRRVFGWWMSPQRVLAMFPDWYGRPQADWAEQIRLTGFPISRQADHDDPRRWALAPELTAFCGAGPPPVAFTFGTGMRHSASLFREAAHACQALGVRGIFLTKFADQLPAPLSPSVRHVGYAPFRTLFPRCAAVVHHGGVGTLAQALAAGVPQLILPIAYDQTDNALRVQRLGAGAWLPARRATARRIAAALGGLLTPGERERSRAVAGRFNTAEDPLDVAAEQVENLASVDRGSAPVLTSRQL